MSTKWMTTTRACSAICIGLGTVILILWYALFPELVSLFSTFANMALNIAACLLISGLALLLSEAYVSHRNLIDTMSGLLILGIAIITLTQTILNYGLSYQEILALKWHPNHVATIENISVAIIVGLILNGVTFLLLPLIRNANDVNLKLDSVINNIDEGIIVFNDNGIIEEFNPKASRIFGYTRNEVMNSKIDIIIPYLSRNNNHQNINHYLKSQSRQLIKQGSVEIPVLHKNGEQIPIEITLAEMLIDDDLHFVGILRDITEKKQIASKLKESEERFRLAFDSSAIGMAIISNDGYFIQVNKALCNILGYEEYELLTANFQTIIISQDRENAVKMRQGLLEGSIKYFKSEERYHHKNGKTVWLFLTHSIIRSVENNSPYFVVQVQDVTDQKRSQEELAYQAFYDSLTGLANRSQLEHGMTTLINATKRNHKRFAVFFLDLDKFKTINDTFGHNVGDEILITIAERLKNSIRKTDIAARLGGDEFVLVMTDIENFEYISTFAEKLISLLCQPIKINGNDFLITTSIGISIYPIDGNDYQTLLRNADLALYQAKEQGRNNYQFCTPEMAKTMRDRLNLENAIKAAIIQDEFQLYYQPQVDVMRDNIVGIEAFIRWTSKELGVVPPQKMIPIAEESGLILPLTEWVIKTAFHQLRQMSNAGFPNLEISINLSVRQFMCDELANWIQASAEEENISPSFLKIEVKERLLLQIPENTLQKLHRLRQSGIHIIIDDFGTGYSSLSYLQKDLVDGIKIDDSLIQSIQTIKNNRTMVIAIINLAKNLGIKVVAEGVETKEQYQFLKENHCDLMQGYYISKSLMNDDLIKFLCDYADRHSSLVTS